MFAGQNWYAVKDGDIHLRWLLNRHYSARHYKDGRKPKLSAGPGRKLCLLTNDGLAGFIWRIFICDVIPPQDGCNCAFFRNEGKQLSSELILEAEQLALAKWTDIKRFWTLVDGDKITSVNPGYCFKKAGWKFNAISKTGKIILFKEVK